MRIAITDDIREEREIIRTLVSDTFSKSGLPVSSVTEFESGEALLAGFKPDSFDLIILDMFMDGLCGYETAQKIREVDREVKLVFCTTSNDFASESYEVEACYYLRKPVTYPAVENMLLRINFKKYERNRCITLPDGQKIIPWRICYTEYVNHLIFIHQVGGETVSVRTTQTVLEELLSHFGYLYSCNKGIMINLHEVKSLQDGLFIMNDGTNVLISRRKLRETADAYNNFRFERTRREVL